MDQYSFKMKKRSGKGVGDYLGKEAIGATRSGNPARSVDNAINKRLTDKMKAIGAVPPPRPKDAPINLQGTTTQAETEMKAAKATQALASATSAAKSAMDLAQITKPEAGAQQTAQEAMTEKATTGGGGHPRYSSHFALYQDYDTFIRPLHPAFHPVPRYVYHPLQLSM